MVPGDIPHQEFWATYSSCSLSQSTLFSIFVSILILLCQPLQLKLQCHSGHTWNTLSQFRVCSKYFKIPSSISQLQKHLLEKHNVPFLELFWQQGPVKPVLSGGHLCRFSYAVRFTDRVILSDWENLASALIPQYFSDMTSISFSLFQRKLKLSFWETPKCLWWISPIPFQEHPLRFGW